MPPTEGQVSDYRGAATVFGALPDADVPIADKGYDSDRFREALAERGIAPRIPGRANRKRPVAYDAELSSSACPAGSRTGGASPPDATDAPTPSSAPSASPLPSFSGYATVIFWYESRA